MSDIEKKDFTSINASFGWLGISVFPLCLFISSFIQQKICGRRISALLSQFTALRLLKKHETLTKYWGLVYSTQLTLEAFADASHTTGSSQLCYMVGLMIVPF